MNKVCVIIQAQLANQLFMIFTCISKAIDENKDFSIYPIYIYPYKYYFNSLLKSLVFKVETDVSFINNTIGYEEKNFEYNPIPKNANVIKGYFQSYKYFDHNKDKIIKILELDKFIDKYQLNYKAIGIHLRFGDYTFNQANHYLLRPSYYINALNKLIDIIPDIDDYKILIFTESNDDLLVNDFIEEFKKGVKKDLIYNKFYELNPGLKDYQDMLYLSSCEHIIISNSTFSWFSAYLCKNNKKRIIYPDKWFGPNNQKNSTKDLFLDDWIMVNS
jgi:hypothetical protein